MKIAICDDEMQYINDIKRHIIQYFTEHGLYYEIYEYNKANELLNCDIVFDIAFLDIEMDEFNGISVGKELQKKNADIVLIFVTAYNHYLDKALDLGITRFFDKPIDSARFYEGLERAIEKVDRTEISFYLKDQTGFVSAKCSDIIYVEIIGRKTKVVTVKGIYYSKDGIKKWKSRLNKSFFESPHNSFIINMNYVTYFSKEHIVLDDKYDVPIAYSKRVDFRRKFIMRMEG